MDEGFSEQITPIQALHLQRIEDVSWAGFDGRSVAKGLRSYAELWHGVVLYDTYYQNTIPGATDIISKELWTLGEMWISVSNLDDAERIMALCRELWGNNDTALSLLGSRWTKAYFGVAVDASVRVRVWWDDDLSLLSLSSLMLRSRCLDEGRFSEDITRVQDLHLQLIGSISFNSFSGERVSKGLRQHRELWVGVIAAHSHQPHPAMRFFDEIPEDTWRPDALWIMAEDLASAQTLIALCRDEWQADEAEFFTAQQARAVIGTDLLDDEVLVRAWWD